MPACLVLPQCKHNLGLFTVSFIKPHFYVQLLHAIILAPVDRRPHTIMHAIILARAIIARVYFRIWTRLSLLNIVDNELGS